MSASRVLKAMLTSGMEETVSKHIDLKEFSDISVELFLEYVYTGTILMNEGEGACLVQLWVMGDKYDIPSLVQFVESLREEHITLENVIDIFLRADTSEAAPIRDSCVALISKETKKFLGEIKMLPHHVQASMFQQLVERDVSFSGAK